MVWLDRGNMDRHGSKTDLEEIRSELAKRLRRELDRKQWILLLNLDLIDPHELTNEDEKQRGWKELIAKVHRIDKHVAQVTEKSADDGNSLRRRVEVTDEVNTEISSVFTKYELQR